MSASRTDGAPIAYPVTLPRRYLGLVTPVLLVLGMGFAAFVSLAAGKVGAGALMTAFVVAGVGWAAFLLSQRQVVTADAVEATSLFGAKRMLRQDISGYRDISGSRYSPPARVLVAREGGQTIRIPKLTGTTHTTWIDALPDLNESERQAAQAALEANPAFGPTVEVRRQRIKAVRYAAVAMTLVGAGLSYACIFWPAEPHALILIAAAMPLLAMAGAFALTHLRQETLGGQRVEIDTRWLIVPSICLPVTGLGLGFRVSQLQLLAPWSVVETGLLLALPVAAVAMWQDRKFLQAQSIWLPLFVIAGAVGWGAGALGEINLAADRAPAQAFVTRITHKHVSHGRHGYTYHVTLAPWGGHTQPSKTEVSSDLYATLQEGEQMCVSQHPGALGFAWFEDRPCPAR